jgi:hypothetical protein
MDFVGGEMVDPIRGHKDAMLMIVIIPQHARLFQLQKQAAKYPLQEVRFDGIKDLAHLRIRGNIPLNQIDTAQIVGLRVTLFQETEQGGGLERKHGEGAFQDIRELVPGIAFPVLRNFLKSFVQDFS